jgi:hypothetical protein
MHKQLCTLVTVLAAGGTAVAQPVPDPVGLVSGVRMPAPRWRTPMFGPGADGIYRNLPWTNGEVPYTFDSTFQGYETSMTNAFAALEAVCGLHFVARGDQPNYLLISLNPDPNYSQTCGIGMMGGEQCLRIGLNGMGNLYHLEFMVMQAVGTYKEHLRPDRDTYIVDTLGIYPTVGDPLATLSGPYDFDSVTHYPRTWDLTGPATIRVNNPYRRFWQWRIGGYAGPNPHLSIGDMWTLNTLYPGGILPPRPFVLIAPTQGQAVGSGGPALFSWESATSATSYRLEVADDLLFQNLVVDLTTTQTQAVPGVSFTANRLYLWRVSATNAQGTTPCAELRWQAFYTAASFPSTLYVDDSAPAGGNGLSWSTALNDVRLATEIAYASDGAVAEIKVGQGTYKPDAGSGDRTGSFLLAAGCALRGGFAGFGAPDPNARNIELFQTTLTGDLLGDDGPNFTNMGENSYRVVVGDLADASALLEGFTIRGGNAAGAFTEERYGAGLWTNYASPRVSRCRFVANSSLNGGAVRLWESDATIEGCTFERNRATQGGGGATVSNPGSATFVNCRFTDNLANNGAGLNVLYGATTTATNCTFRGNAATNAGGGVHTNFSASASLTNCILWGNTSAPSSGPQLGISNSSGMPTSATVSRCDMAGGPAAVFDPGNTLNWGSGNIDADPFWVNPTAGDLSLRPFSPCIDAGDNTAVPAGILTDFLGNPRFRDDTGTVNAGIPGGAGGAAIVDMGAFEFQGTTCYANCDGSTTPPVLNVLDFSCFLNKFAAGDTCANCDGSTTPPVLNVLDFSCFLNRFAVGCS